MKIAVIGAGASGLASAREFQARGHDVTVFEQGSDLGGVWAYEAEVEDDLLGLQPTQRVYSSLYENLRTNLPSDLMAFREYAFDASGGGEDHWPRFPHHSCVRTYLERYAEHFDLKKLIQFDQRVVSLTWHKLNANRWLLETADGVSAEFEAVAICSGHFSEPRVPEIKGLPSFAGTVLHSHNYRRPEDFAGQTVTVIGRGASGADIVQELLPFAKHVYWAGFSDLAVRHNLTRVPFPTGISHDGFETGQEHFQADTMLLCTGYRYELPFLEESIVSIVDNFVSPLYLDIIPPRYPTLGLIGLPFLVVPFPLYAMQAKWFAASLEREFELPQTSEMFRACDARERSLHLRGTLQRHFHRLGDEQEEYYNQLADQCGAPRLPEWFAALASEAQTLRQKHPADFRDRELSIPRQRHA